MGETEFLNQLNHYVTKWFTVSKRSNRITSCESFDLRPVHTKDDKDIVLKIILSIKEQQSLHHNYNDKATEKRYRWNHFQNDFFHLMNNKNTDSQSESILL